MFKKEKSFLPAEILFRVIPNIEETTLDDFFSLPINIQNDIISDIKSQEKRGEDKKKISLRTIDLIERGKELNKMNEPSDVKPKPKSSLQELEKKEAEKFATEGTEYGPEYYEK